MKRLMFTAVAVILLLPAVSIQAQAPNQGQILFWSDRDGDFDIYLMNGSDAVNLTQNDAGDAWATWSPDGSMIAFESDRDGHRQIYVMNADGSDARSFTEADARDTGPAIWSPEGDQLAFMSWLPTDDDTTNLAYLIVANVDGSDLQQLTPGLDPTFIANTLSWSPDGTRIVLEGPGEQDTIQDIYSVAVDGSDFRNLTKDPRGDVWPAFSPDGNQIAFSTERDGNVEIYVMNVDGSDPRNLTNMPDRYDARPVWSPDGEQIAFASTSMQDRQDQEIYVMNADGSDIRPLTSGGGAEDFPAWSADGNQVAYQVTGDEGLVDIGVIDVDGHDPHNLTQDAATDYFPQWKPVSIRQ